MCACCLNHYATQHIDVVVFHESAVHRRRCTESVQAARCGASLLSVMTGDAASRGALSTHAHLLHAACPAHRRMGYRNTGHCLHTYRLSCRKHRDSLATWLLKAAVRVARCSHSRQPAAVVARNSYAHHHEACKHRQYAHLSFHRCKITNKICKKPKKQGH